MDGLITAAARALATGDPLAALNGVALRDDPPALALRGIAMAQLGDLPRAKVLLRAAARGFGPREEVARARCMVAEAEIALVLRDLEAPARVLDLAAEVLARHGDHANAGHARVLAARRLLLIGRLNEAERMIDALDTAALPLPSRVGRELVLAGIALRRLRSRAAQQTLARASRLATAAGIAGLVAEVESVRQALQAPAARLLVRGSARLMSLGDVERLLASTTLVIDACRPALRRRGVVVPLDGRPVLLALARALGEAWPHDVPRAALIAAAFRARHVDESHRARLRVEIGRLRRLLGPLAGIAATEAGFVLQPAGGARLAVLAPPVEDAHADVLALLADGEAWASSALALALGVSPRSAQRALDVLAAAGKVQSLGRGRARRWMTPPVPGFPTALLLPAPLPNG